MPTPQNLLEFIRLDPQGKLARGLAGAQLVSLLRQVEDCIDEIDKFLKELPKSEIDARATRAGLEHLRDSLIEFHGFGWDYFEYVAESDCGNLPNQALALRKIQNEILTLRPLVEQRRTPKLLGFLNAADALAIDFIAKCGLREGSYYANQGDKGENKGEIKRFLTFFEETLWIRQSKLRYPRVPSISLPLSTWRSPWLWLGLGHEVGHYIYQNLENQLEQTYLKDALEEAIGKIIKGKQAQTLWRQWMEEVFADVYGVLVLGPSYTESLICQILLPCLRDGVPLLDNDQDHPAIFLRPFLHFELLRQSSQRHTGNNQTSLTQEIVRLEAFWYRVCELLIPEQQRTTGQDAFAYWGQQRIGGSQLRAMTCRNHIPAIVNKLLDTLAQFKDVHYYTAQVHDAVVQVAKDLAGPTHFKQLNVPGVLEAELPTLALSVAWYTWKELTDVHNRRSNKLVHLCEWIKQTARGSRDEKYKRRNTDVQPIPDGTDLINTRTNRQQGEAFEKLLAELQAKQDTQPMISTEKGCQLVAELLAVDFSVQNAVLNNESRCPLGQHCCPD